MNLKIKWLYYWGRYLLRIKLPIIWKRLGCNYTSHDFLEAEEVNQSLSAIIQEGKPCMVCRIGANESFSLRTFEMKHKKNYNKALHQLVTCAGFFPEEMESVLRFVQVMEEAMKYMDICGTLLCPLDDYFLERYASKQCKVTILDYIDSTSRKVPWTGDLRGKKVLVVHPFSKTIEQQYKKRELIFPDRDVLPEFELITYKAVQTSAGQKDERFANWFEALDFMSEEIRGLEFDVALLGCGAYGLPLAARIKQQGKQAVQIGGSLQLLFGIKGRRWDTDPGVTAFYNDAWTYPDEEETPRGASMVEGACYWK